jgi:hypothetical protein
MRFSRTSFVATFLLVPTVCLAGASAHATGVATTCPRALVAPGDSAPNVVQAAKRSEPKAEVVGVLSLSPFSLGTDDTWRRIARGTCGTQVASRSWVAFYYRPQWAKRSASIAEGVAYLALTQSGWRIWYRYR